MFRLRAGASVASPALVFPAIDELVYRFPAPQSGVLIAGAVRSRRHFRQPGPPAYFASVQAGALTMRMKRTCNCLCIFQHPR